MPIKARVLYEYHKGAEDELTLCVNDIVTILDKDLPDEGWWKVMSPSREICVHGVRHLRGN